MKNIMKNLFLFATLSSLLTMTAVARTKFQPHPSIQTLYLEIPEGTPVFIDLFGFAFFFNLENGRKMQVDEEMAKYNFELVSLAA